MIKFILSLCFPERTKREGGENLIRIGEKRTYKRQGSNSIGDENSVDNTEKSFVNSKRGEGKGEIHSTVHNMVRNRLTTKSRS